MTPVYITSWTGIFVGPRTSTDTGEQDESFSPLTGVMPGLPEGSALNLVTILTPYYEDVLWHRGTVSVTAEHDGVRPN
jgi:hypothetical protein